MIFELGNTIIIRMIILILLILYSCNEWQMNSTIDHASDKKNASKAPRSLMISSSDFELVVDTTILGVMYSYTIPNNDTIQYIQTTDSDFKTSDGLRVGFPLNRAFPHAVTDIIWERGWGHYIQLKSGWNAFINSNPVENKVHNDAEILLFFKRDSSFLIDTLK